MALSNVEIQEMLSTLESIKVYGKKLEQRFSLEIAECHPNYQKSVINLLYYLALRHHDIVGLQRKLGHLGLSRLGKAESHIQTSIQAIENNLKRLLGELVPQGDNSGFEEGKSLLGVHSKELLGAPPEEHRARIMVTFPSEAAEDEQLVFDLLNAGMNIARINCAHDNPERWGKMIEHLNKAREKTGLPCKIAMDLAGPKLRTGKIAPGPQVMHLSPKRDVWGRIIESYSAWIVPDTAEDLAAGLSPLPLPDRFLQQIELGDEIFFLDTRDKKRKLKVIEKRAPGFLVELEENSYLETGTNFELIREGQTIIQAPLGYLPPIEQKIVLHIGDTLILHKEDLPGESTVFNEKGEVIKPAHVAAPLPSLYSDLRSGEMILFDDGKIEGLIESVSQDEIKVKITHARQEGDKLKSEKGINLPQSNLRLRGLTEKDKEDLKFVVQHADIINMSFVNEPEDITELLQEIDTLKPARKPGIIIKIETQKGVMNLPGILLKAMQHCPVGVMIARGDLAVECGWNHLAEVQEEILRICEAAHIPNVWATQVLESVAKKGRPSRAEISDAASAQRAECVMLNKGPYILEAIRILKEILHSMQAHQDKKAPMLPVLKVPQIFNVSEE